MDRAQWVVDELAKLLTQAGYAATSSYHELRVGSIVYRTYNRGRAGRAVYFDGRIFRWNRGNLLQDVLQHVISSFVTHANAAEREARRANLRQMLSIMAAGGTRQWSDEWNVSENIGISLAADGEHKVLRFTTDNLATLQKALGLMLLFEKEKFNVNEYAFMRAVAELPEDFTSSLVFADWLDEHDMPERAAEVRRRCENSSG